MKKPSIFSKDYEKIMRKRKRKRIVIGILSICIIGILVTEVANYDFSKLKDVLIILPTLALSKSGFGSRQQSTLSKVLT